VNDLQPGKVYVLPLKNIKNYFEGSTFPEKSGRCNSGSGLYQYQ